MNNSWRRFKPRNLILPKSWREFFILNIRYIGFFLALLIIGLSIFFGYRYYLANTTIIPTEGGTLVEGMAGQPEMINPILSQTNDVDRDLSKLIFSGLLTFDKNRQLVGDIAEKWDLSEDEKTYTVYLKKGIKWHDNEELNADDVVFTYQLIQNPGYPGTLADNWREISITKLDDYTVQFVLSEVFSPFLVNLTTGILPEHLLKDIRPDQLDDADFNRQPIGSGPYKMSKIKLDKNNLSFDSIELKKFDEYYGSKPYITDVIFKFFPDYNSLYDAYKNKEVMSISGVLIADWPYVSNTINNISIYDIALPQYTAIFLNQDSDKTFLIEPYVKEALFYAIDRERIVREVLHEKGVVVDTPILSGYLGHNPDILHIYQDIEKAKEVLKQGKWEDVDGDGVRERDNIRLSFDLVTSDNPDFVLAANIIRQNWQEIGVELKVTNYNIGDLEDEYIKTRNYDSLLFGENLGQDPDPYVYWHSSQAKDPGLNLANYVNVEIDRYLEKGRRSNDQDTRIHSYLPMQEVIFDDKPALFLYRPYYIYAVNPSVQGINVDHAINPADRFQFISDWHIKTKRVWNDRSN